MELTSFGIVGGIVMLLACVAICFLVIIQESPQHGGGLSALSGGGSSGSDSFYSKNQGRTKEAMLTRVTTVLCVVFFVVTLVTVGLTVWL